MGQEYAYQGELYGLEGRPLNPLSDSQLQSNGDSAASTSGRDDSDPGGVHYGPQWGLLTLTQPVTASEVSTPWTAATLNTSVDIFCLT